MRIEGRAGGWDLSGATAGWSPETAGCRNLTTGDEVTIALAGDQVILFASGSAD